MIKMKHNPVELQTLLLNGLPAISAYLHTSCLRSGTPESPHLFTNHHHQPLLSEVLLNLPFVQVQPFRVSFDSFMFSVHPLSMSLLRNSYIHPTYGMSQNPCMTTCSLSVQTCHNYSYQLVPTVIDSSLDSYNSFLN